MIYVALTFGLSYALWFFYLSVMALKRARDSGGLRPVALWLGYPILIVGLVIDFLVNVFVATALFLELPKEMTVTKRMTRHITKDRKDWRTGLSLWITFNLLDVFDPSGSHR